MTALDTLLNNPFVQTLVVGGIGWLVNKAFGKKADSTLAKATSALATSVALMAQFALTETGRTPAAMITAFKGIVAIQFAKVGFTESQRAPYQPLIDAAIAKAVTEWVRGHAAPLALTMPITEKVA